MRGCVRLRYTGRRRRGCGVGHWPSRRRWAGDCKYVVEGKVLTDAYSQVPAFAKRRTRAVTCDVLLFSDFLYQS